MRVLVLPRVAELRDGLLLAVGNEDRVVTEAFAAARLRSDAAFEDPRAAYLSAVGRDPDRLPRALAEVPYSIWPNSATATARWPLH